MSTTRSSVEDPHAFGDRVFDGRYTVEKREFADGDTRTLVKHTVGWSPTNHVTITVWCERGSVWREYYEHDRRRTREVLSLDEWDGSVHPDYT
jgi:hypothetical protein